MTMTKTKQYTAQEMRDMAENIIMLEDDWIEDAAHMLRQAADAMEREESDVVLCRKCQTERTGEGYGDVPPHVGEDDICDRCEIAEHLRRGEKRDKKYEYAVKICFGSEEDYTSASERRLV